MSFSDYMDSLGAKRVPIAGKGTHRIHTTGKDYSTIDYTVGQQLPGFDKSRSGFGSYGYGQDFNSGGRASYRSGYQDAQGGFLGYGNSTADLQNVPGNSIGYSTYAVNEPGRLADVEAKNIANQQARLQYEQDYQAAQAAKLAAQAQQPHFQGQGLVGMGQAPQQSSMGRGSGFAPGQQYAGGMGRGSGAGLLGGMGRGGGQ